MNPPLYDYVIMCWGFFAFSALSSDAFLTESKEQNQPFNQYFLFTALVFGVCVFFWLLILILRHSSRVERSQDEHPVSFEVFCRDFSPEI